MKIELRKIDESNRAECMAIKVSEQQTKYISSVEHSLRDAEENPDIARAFAVYADGRAVGFAMFAFDENNEDHNDRYWLWRFMINSSEQGKGFGSAALNEIIEYFRNNGADQITLSTKPENTAALGLYHKFGFKENGDMNDDEIVLKLFL